jgi:hypothetical protein
MNEHLSPVFFSVESSYRDAVQFSVGRSTWSITNVSTWPVADSSRNPSASGSTAKIDSSAPGGKGGSFSGCDMPGGDGDEVI